MFSSKSWVRNVYDQFESVFQDVDDFMRKETMTFVENHVQSDGTSVKRFYHDVVEDIEPPSKAGNSREADASLPTGVETDAIFSETHKNSMPTMHEDENNSSCDILTDSSLCMVEDFHSDESGSRSYQTVARDSLDSSTCDISSQVESFDETRALDIAFSVDEFDSEKRDEDGLSETKMSFPPESDMDDMHLDMEAVDLSPEMKHGEPSVILAGNSFHAAFHRKRNFGYYKKLIQDAITSQKRLSKEYEYLGVLYGDIESDLSHHCEPVHAPSSTNTSAHAATTQSFHDMSEIDWELV